MLRMLTSVLVGVLSLNRCLLAQTPERFMLRAAVEREAAHLASRAAAPTATKAAPSQEPAHTRDNDWNTVRGLAVGTRLIVFLQNGTRVQGVLVNAGEASVRVLAGGRERTLLRAEIVEVRRGHRLSVAQHAGIGLLLGGMTGIVAGSAAACDPRRCGGEGGLATAGGLVFGTFLGGLGGFVFGEAVHARPGRLVYAGVSP